MSESFQGRGSPHIVIIGAGAAGMIAAAHAARKGAQVTLLEKNNKTGVKILMSGGTRCNITHDTDARGIVEAFGHAKRFLQPSVGVFGPADVVRLFESLGVATKREETGKIFPVSDRAVHVRDALHRDLHDAGAKLHLGTAVKAITQINDGATFRVTCEDSLGQHELIADRVIVTAGGKSWPGCGTTGDAYDWLEQLGHQIVRPRPALVPLVGGTEATRELSGLTLSDVVAEVFTPHHRAGKKPQLRRRSSWLFTHFGFSGPAAMDVSGTLTAAESMRACRLQVDLLPSQTEIQVRDSLSQRSGLTGKKNLATTLGQWLPSRLAMQLANSPDVRTSRGSETPMAEVSGQAIHQLVEKLKRWQLPVHDTRGFAKAEVTAGGVALKEVDPRTMQSRIVPGLFIAGEVLDVDGWIGGYNFQAAFSTGRAAADSAALH